MAKIRLPPTQARRRELAFWIVLAIVLFLWGELERKEAANAIDRTDAGDWRRELGRTG